MARNELRPRLSSPSTDARPEGYSSQNSMTWEQKLMALKALTTTEVKMREPGNWYVSAHARAIKSGELARSEYGNGKTPEEAVNDDWSKIAQDHPEVILTGGPVRRVVRWNGYMWEDRPV